MKTYATWEVIKMLTENRKLEFKTVGRNSNYSVEIDSEGIVFNSTKELMHITNKFLENEWVLVPQPVTFMEATKAFNIGKNVRVEYLGSGNGKPKTTIFKQAYESKPGIMNCSDESLTFFIIATGKWFIEECEN